MTMPMCSPATASRCARPESRNAWWSAVGAVAGEQRGGDAGAVGRQHRLDPPRDGVAQRLDAARETRRRTQRHHLALAEREAVAPQAAEEGVALQVPAARIGRRRGRAQQRAQAHGVAGIRSRVAGPQPHAQGAGKRRIRAVQPNVAQHDAAADRQRLDAEHGAGQPGRLARQHIDRRGAQRGELGGGEAERPGRQHQQQPPQHRPRAGKDSARCRRQQQSEARPDRRLLVEREIDQRAGAHADRQPQRVTLPLQVQRDHQPGREPQAGRPAEHRGSQHPSTSGQKLTACFLRLG
jgi:hypothetical protein